ncbi:hypothetical protein KBG31_01990 [Patescibacteria group bacterium]|nr:hypothetical protein [Patescibacteria group bacterium]
MKRFLQNKTFFAIFILLNLGMVFFPGFAAAGDRSDYYLNYFKKELNFPVVRVEREEIPLDGSFYFHQSTQDSQTTKDIFLNKLSFSSPLPKGFVKITDSKGFFTNPASLSPKDWQLVFSSDEFLDLNFGNTIFICDSPYKSEKFECSYDYVAPLDLKLVSISTSPVASDIKIAISTADNPKIIVIPEQILYTPSFRGKLTEYLGSYRWSLDFTDFSPQLTPTSEPFNILKSWGFETFTYAFSFLVFIVVFRKLLVHLVHSPKDFLKKQTYVDYYNNMVLTFMRIHDFLLLGVIMGAVLFVPLTIFATVRYTNSYNYEAFSTFFSVVFNPSSIKMAITTLNKTLFVFYAYILVYAVVLGMYFLPSFLELTQASLNKLFKEEKNIINPSLTKFLVLSFVVLGIFLSFAGDLVSLLPFLITLLSLSLYFSYLLLKSNPVFSPKEKTIAISVVSLTFILSFGINFYLSNKKAEGRYQKLIDVTDKIVMLPYKKISTFEVFYDPMILRDFPHPLLIDSFLVYHPNYLKIENKPLSKDSDFSRDYIVLGAPKEDYLKSVLKMRNLQKELYTNKVSSFFMLPNFKFEYLGNYSLRLEISCLQDLNPSLIELEIYQLDNKSKVSTRKVDLLNFPGCLRGDNPVFVVPVEMPYILDASLVLGLSGFDLEFITSLQFFKNNFPLDLTFLDYAPQGKVLKSNYIQGQSLQVYSFSSHVPPNGRDFLREDVRKNGAEFDLGSIATELKKEGLVGNAFVIWSLNEAVVLRNEYLE